MYRHIFGFNDP